MALYPFLAEDGTQTELWFDMNEAPEIGSFVDVEGIRYKRLVSRMSKPKVAQEVRSFQIRDDHPDVPYYDEDNYACFPGGVKQAREFSKKHNERLGIDDLELDT